MKISFMTFASSDWTRGPARFRRDLDEIRRRFGFFEESLVYSEKDLGADYQSRFSPYYSDHGFAYFSWKPYSIRQALSGVGDGDYLLYLDCGCALPMGRIGAFLDDLRAAAEKAEAERPLMTLTTYIDRNPALRIPNACIVKRSILDKFGLAGDRRFLFEFPHWQAGVALVKKTQAAMDFLGRWYRFYLDNYESCVRGGYTDRRGELGCFIHNGSDQAIMQCMLYAEKQSVSSGLNFVYGYDLIAHILG